MTTPQLATQTEYGRLYARQVGAPAQVPSITTVIAAQPLDLGGWHGHMAAKELINHPDLERALNNRALQRTLIRDTAAAAERYRDSAAARGDRVHFYCEQVALAALGQEHEMARALDQLRSHGEEGYAQAFDTWWRAFKVEPLAAEVTVWNEEVGYAGTLDLVARIGGQTCLIDYKTKGSDRGGRVKNLDPKVIMQLTAGLKAQEQVVDAHAGTWEPWRYGDASVLMGVALGEHEARAFRANPEYLPHYWRQFYVLRQAWEANRNTAALPAPLLELPPPSERTAP